MRTVAVGMHMRKDRLNHYKAMVALFVKVVSRNIRSIATPKRIINVGISMIGVIFPGANLFDLQFTYKYSKALVIRKTRLWLDQLKEKITLSPQPCNSGC